VTLAGLALAGTAIGLLNTAHLEAHGVVIPALDGGASDRAIPYTPACSDGAIPVCLHPAYRSYLPGITAALDPVLHEVGDLPGAPARVTQVATNYGGPSQYETVNIITSPPVFELALGNLDSRAAGIDPLEDQIRFLFLHAFVGAGPRGGNPAQQAVLAALLRRVGVSFAAQQRLLAPTPSVTIGSNGGLSGPQEGSPIYAVAERFALQSVAAQRTWLTSHLAALRLGGLTLDDLP
jgi:hypothetical protein